MSFNAFNTQVISLCIDLLISWEANENMSWYCWHYCCMIGHKVFFDNTKRFSFLCMKDLDLRLKESKGKISQKSTRRNQYCQSPDICLYVWGDAAHRTAKVPLPPIVHYFTPTWPGVSCPLLIKQRFANNYNAYFIIE